MGSSAHACLLIASMLNAKKKINIDVAIDVRIMILSFAVHNKKYADVGKNF